MARKKIKFAIVGCGYISKKHIEAICLNHETSKLIALCDTNSETLNDCCKDMDLDRFKSLDELLDKSDADVIVLTTNSGLHAQQTIQIAKAGKHIVTEKPMATTFNDGKAMVKACDDAGVKLFVVKQIRKKNHIHLIKRLVENNKMGKIYSVAVNLFWNRPQSYYDSSAWRGTWEFDGGAFMNQASHYIDLLDWIFGPIDSVVSFTATLARNIQVEDTGVAAIKWRSGALGTLNVTMLTYLHNIESSITIIAEKGSVKIGGAGGDDVLFWEFQDNEINEMIDLDINKDISKNYHDLFYRDVIDELNTGKSIATSGIEGLRSLELIIAIYLSARDGKKVSLPLKY